MDKEVYEARLAGWKQVVQQCQERPAGMTQKEWLAQNEIPEARFYYWLRKVRKENRPDQGTHLGRKWISFAVQATGGWLFFLAAEVTSI